VYRSTTGELFCGGPPLREQRAAGAGTPD